MKRAPRILISAGEASGDRLGAGLVRALRARRPDLEVIGMGGEEMRSAGVEIVQPASEVALVGFVEVFTHLGQLRRAMARMKEAVERFRPDVVVPIDFPDFNFKLARHAAGLGHDVVYFVSPQVWAWRRGRVRTMAGFVRRVLVLFPFEEAFYREAGIPVDFVGHPAVEHEVDGSRGRLVELGLDPGREAVALLPGSRRGEVRRHLPILLEAAKRLERRRPGIQFFVPRAAPLQRTELQSSIDAGGLDCVRLAELPDLGRIAPFDAAVVTSGTASLEVALTGVPMVIVYRVGLVNYLLGRALVRVDHIGLPNLVAGRRIVPELVQADFNPSRVADEVDALLSGSGEGMRGELVRLRERLGGPGAFERAADGVLAVLDRS